MSMKKFLYKSGLFFLPIAVILFPAWIHLTGHREIKSVSEMVDQNQKNGGLIGLAYTDPMHLVKHAVIERRQPKIIALGTSRVLQFRALVFEESAAFYNCGRSVRRVQDLKSFLTAYPGDKPTMIILGLDQDFFGVEDEDLEREPRSYKLHKTTYASRVVKGTKAFFNSLQEGKVKLGQVSPDASSYIGRNARLYSEGYRRDGSYIYGERLSGDRGGGEYTFEKTIKRIDKRKGRFANAEKIHPGAIKEIEEFLEVCQNNQIHVVAFLPPYANGVYRRFAKERSEYPHVFETHAVLEPVFLKRGFLLFDFSDIASLGSNEFETIDGYHASETAYLKIIYKMVEIDSRLKAVVDVSVMESLLSEPYSARQLTQELEENSPRRPVIINQPLK
jgi:hypothetical protein